jgi:hypothetical protein
VFGYVYRMDEQLAIRHAVAILATLGPPGRMLSGSKTGYRDQHPEHLPVFNANVCIAAGKVWWGDLDLTVDEAALLDLSSQTGEVVSVLYESDGRFRHEEAPLIGEAVFSAAPTGHTRFDPIQAERRSDGHVYVRPRPQPRRWRRPARPRMWRVWHVDVRREESRDPDGVQTSRLLRIGHHDRIQRSPLFVLGLHTWSREARGAWLEWTWYPSGHRSWAPPISGRAKWHARRVRPYVGIRVAPGLAHEIRLGVSIGPVDLVWG